MNMKNGFSTIFLIVFLLRKELSATISQGPSNAVAEIGKQVKLNCIATAAIGYWYFSKNGVLADEVIITGPGCSALNPVYDDHYEVEPLGGGTTCNLIVSNITMEQGGVYRCQEGTSQEFSILTVTDSSPVITVNNTNGTRTVVENEYVIFECALNHNGSVNPAPTLRPYFYWTNSSGNVSSSYNSTTANTAVSQITVTAGRQNITSYTCHVYFQLIPPTTPNYASNTPAVSSSASSSVIEVLYYPKITSLTSSVSTTDNCVYKQENLTCTADANPPAEYEWVDLSNNTMITGAVKSITSGGQYQCTAYNYIWNKRYNNTEIANETTCYPPYNLTITGPSCVNNTCTCAENQTEVMLTCMAEGNPNVTYQWRSDVFGHENLGSQAIQKAEFDGNYICTATNTFGNQPHSETVSVLVFRCRAPPTTMPTTTQSTTKLSTVDPTTTPHNVTTTPSSVPIGALVGGIIIGSWFVANAIATPAFTGYYNAGTNDGSGHTKTKRNKTRLNKRFPWLRKMLPCLNDTKEGAGTNCLWVSLFVLLGTFTGIVTFPIWILLAIKSETNIETSALNKRENSEENGSAANGRRSVNSPHSPSPPGNQTRAVGQHLEGPYQNESRENIELSSSHHSRNHLLTDSPTSSTPPQGKPPPPPKKTAPNTPNTPGRAQNYIVNEPAVMDPNHTTYADLPFMPHVPPTRPVQYLDGTEDAYAELKKT